MHLFFLLTYVPERKMNIPDLEMVKLEFSHWMFMVEKTSLSCETGSSRRRVRKRKKRGEKNKRNI